MKDDKGAMKSSSGKENEPGLENGKKKTKEERPATKVVVRRLPPTMIQDQFKVQVAPLPEVDYFYFVPADMSLTPNAFSRAYINFVDQSDLFIFTQKFDGYVFVDTKGGEFPAVVEFAPFQRIPKNRPNRKKDPKVGTIESDPVYIQFKELLEASSLENKTSANASKQHFFETSLEPEKKEASNTPLLDYIKNKRAERQRIREEKREEKRKRDLERKRAKEEQRRIKKDDDTSVLKQTPASLDHPTLPTPNDAKLKKAYSKNDQKNNTQGKKQPFLHSADVNGSTDGQEVSKKVRDLVNLFDKAITEGSSNVLGQQNYIINDPIVICANHKDIETEIIKSTCKNKVNKISENCPKKILSKTLQINNALESNKYQCFESKKMYSCNNRMPLVGSRSRVFVPRPNKSLAPQYDFFRPIKLETSQQRDNRRTEKIEEIKKDGSDTKFPAEIFKKNLEKVVADVLGNSTVNKNTNESVISKPKTFMKRVIIGSGEQCARPGFNSPNFYLPPRTFGCGPTQCVSPTPKPEPNEVCQTPSTQPSKSLPFGRGPFPAIFKKSLPPFSKTVIYSSKSDGTIENTESHVKVGGSEQSIKLKINPLVVETRSPFVRRPYVMAKRSLIVDKSYKVTL